MSPDRLLNSGVSEMCPHPPNVRSNMDIHHLLCTLLHRHQREILIPGLLPWGIDAVVFCRKCDRHRGKPVRSLNPSALRA